MNMFAPKTRFLALAILLCLPVIAHAQQSVSRDGTAIVIGGNEKPDAATKLNPSAACMLPLPPVSNADQAGISNYQAQREKFRECVARDPNASQQNLDRSLAAIGDDENDATDIIQQENRGALNRLGARR